MVGSLTKKGFGSINASYANRYWIENPKQKYIPKGYINISHTCEAYIIEQHKQGIDISEWYLIHSVLLGNIEKTECGRLDVNGLYIPLTMMDIKLNADWSQECKIFSKTPISIGIKSMPIIQILSINLHEQEEVEKKIFTKEEFELLYPPIETKLINAVAIQTDSYRFGCSLNPHCESNELNTYTVVLKHNFYMMQTEITVDLYRKHKEYESDCPQCPVTVSWLDAIKFANWLSRENSRDECYLVNDMYVELVSGCNGWRLPTEIEWEYAAKANNKYSYSGSNQANDVSWNISNSDGKTHIVGGKNPNSFGLHDLSGNVWEWCWGNEYFNNSTLEPSHNLLIDSSHVIRGGSYKNEPEQVRNENRRNRKRWNWKESQNQLGSV